jgi:glyoxylase-like metal-dependent hydrolase (beta-lactamase superfamily II)
MKLYFCDSGIQKYFLMKKKKILIIAGIVLLVILTVAGFLLYPAYHFFFSKGTEQPFERLTILSGGGGNSGILVTDKAVFVIDTKMGSDAKDLFNLAKKKAGALPIVVINTHFHGDHVKGNHLYSGSRIYIGSYEKAFLQKEVDAENMPTNFVSDSLAFISKTDTIILYDMGQGHTFHDMVVYLKNRNTVFTGDLVFHDINPFLKRESGADVEKWVSALEKLRNIPDLQTVVPGHGKTGGPELIFSMIGYFEDMKKAAVKPAKEKILVEKYKDWVNLPMMTSPGTTIEYIRNSSNRK